MGSQVCMCEFYRAPTFSCGKRSGNRASRVFVPFSFWSAHQPTSMWVMCVGGYCRFMGIVIIYGKVIKGSKISSICFAFIITQSNNILDLFLYCWAAWTADVRLAPPPQTHLVKATLLIRLVGKICSQKGFWTRQALCFGGKEKVNNCLHLHVARTNGNLGTITHFFILEVQQRTVLQLI